MKSLLAILLLASVSSQAQNMSAYYDLQSRLRVIDNGTDKEIYHLQAKKFKASNSYLLFEDANYNLMVYKDGKTEQLSPRVDDFMVTDYLSCYQVKDQLYVYDGEDKEVLTMALGRYQVSDSLVMYYDTRMKMSYIYYKGEKFEVQGAPINFPLTKAKLAANIMAYVDRNLNLTVFYQGEFYDILNSSAPLRYEVGQDVMAFVDPDLNSFNIWSKGDWEELEDHIPVSYRLGDSKVYWVNRIDELKMNDGVESHLITNIPPQGYQVRDSVATYWFNNQWFWINRGKSELLENYIPGTVKMDDGNLAYLDNLNRLTVIANGEKQIVSEPRTKIHTVNGNMILYTEGVNPVIKYYQFGKEVN